MCEKSCKSCARSQRPTEVKIRSGETLVVHAKSSTVTISDKGVSILSKGSVEINSSLVAVETSST